MNHSNDRVWELRENLTAYNATFVALAEALRPSELLAPAEERHTEMTADDVMNRCHETACRETGPASELLRRALPKLHARRRDRRPGPHPIQE
jgi:hypothetical protein